MSTGKRAFSGENTTDILAAVVKTEPDLARAPGQVQRLLRRCLEKDPMKRLRHIGDVWEVLENEDTAEETAPLRSRLRMGSRLSIWAGDRGGGAGGHRGYRMGDRLARNATGPRTGPRGCF
jgi:hypothetical protein